MNLKFNRRRINLKSRMLLLILSTTIIIFVVSVGYIGLSSRSMAYESAKENAKAVAVQSALRIENQLNVSMDAIRTLANAFGTWKNWPDSLWLRYVQDMYHPVFENNPQIYKLWDSWEMNMVDEDYSMPYGRYVNTFFRTNGQIQYSSVTRSMDGDPPLYGKIKAEARESIWEPYWDVFSEQGESKKFMTSMSVPIKLYGKYAGIVAVDITMDALQDIVTRINPMKNSYGLLISNEGILISHPDTAFIGKNVAEAMTEFEAKYDLRERIRKGESFAFRDVDTVLNEEIYFAIEPVNVGLTKTPWALGLVVPVDVITAEADNNLLISGLVALLGLILLSSLIYIIAVRISKPIGLATNRLKRIELGDIHGIDDIEINRLDEIGDMAESLNKVVAGLNETAEFAEEIGKGNLSSEYNPKSDNDVLGNALINMRQSLRVARAEEEKRKAEDEKQRWITNGIAKFGEILRKDNDNLKQLSFNIISNLVNYLDANQGGIFVLNDKSEDDHFFELQAAVAYDRRRYLKKEIRIGEDLVGRCAHERAAIYMTDIPDDYVEITSGMGNANPTSILIVPVMINEIVYGVIEIATFNKLDPFQIEFVEKIGESIASTLNTVKVNQRTSRLLSESQQQQEELSSQEEEMRQNLEELQATQEEAARREFELRGVINALSSSTYTVEYDLYGGITDVNETYADLIGLSREQMLGMNHKDGIDFSNISKEDYERFWEDLRHGIPRTDVNKIDYNNQIFYLKETYTPIVDEDETPYKILKIGFNITKEYKLSEELEALKEHYNNLEQNSVDSEKAISDLKDELNSEKAENMKLQGQIEELLKENNISVKNSKSEESAEKKSIDSKQNPVQLPTAGEPLLEMAQNMLTGIEEMDEQHVRIVDMMNELFKAIVSKANTKQRNELIKTFTDYTSFHFNNEERYFEDFSFDEAANHKKAHSDFIKLIRELEVNINKGKEEAGNAVLVKMRDWLINHFTNDDQMYVELFKANGL
jgi:methyl-accepting chemotaxis protein